MHEFSITRAMLDQALAEASRHGARSISRIRLLLGESGGVAPDCVRFYFDQMKPGTAAAEAELEFTTVPLRIRCPKCGTQWGLGTPAPSPTRPLDPSLDGMCSCNAGGEVVSGQELVLASIDVD